MQGWLVSGGDGLQHNMGLGFDKVYVHNVGRNQGEFIRAYGERAISKLGWLE
jgi:coenzyme F420-dependent glucose-6-phosphate dehydrogenase